MEGSAGTKWSPECGSAKAPLTVPGRRFSAEALGLGRISVEGPAVYLGFRASSTCIVVSCSFALGGRGLWQPNSSALSRLFAELRAVPFRPLRLFFFFAFCSEMLFLSFKNRLEADKVIIFSLNSASLWTYSKKCKIRTILNITFYSS